jgi:hypothetical protein
VLERDVEERGACLREQLVAVAELTVDVDAAPTAVGHPRGQAQLPVDEHGPPEAEEDARGHRRKAVPGGQEPAGFVERRPDEATVDDPGAGLVPLVEGEGRLVPRDALLGGLGEMDSVRVVAAAPAGRVVMRRDPRYRSPPRSKWAR